MASQAPSIRSRLLQLVLACVVPATLLAAGVLAYDYQQQRQALVGTTQTAVRGMALALDAELAQPRLALSTLARARLLAAAQWPAFHAQMREVEPPLDLAGLFVLGRDGRLLLHTAGTAGRALPPPPTAVAPRPGTTRPFVTGLLTDPVTGRRGMAIVVPLPDDAPAQALGGWLPLERLPELLERQKLPHDWIAAVLDDSGTVLARSHDMEVYAGRPATAALRARMAERDEDAFNTVSLDGTEVITVFSKAPELDWAVAVGLPRRALEAPLRERFAWLGALAVGLLLGTLALAWLLGGRLVRAIQSLRAPTAALGRGEPVELPPLTFREAQQLGSSLLEAAQRQQAATAELRQSNEALVRSNLELQQYAFVASHDLRGPLNTISSYLDLLQRKHRAELSPAATGLVQRAAAATRQLDLLAQALLGYARLEGSARRFTDVDLNQLLQDAADALDAELQAVGAQLTHDALPVVWGDRTQLAQLLQNLVGNAIKYRSAAPPRIHVSARRQAPRWELSVQDNGIGIEPRHQARIFEIFKRLHTQHEIPGAGIGLAICKRVVQAHHGTLWVESEPGQGSTFRFTLADKEVHP